MQLLHRQNRYSPTMTPDKELQDLREALKASPDNAYIRRLLINKLRGLAGHEAELEREINTLMKREPHDLDLKQALIEVYHKQGKNSACLIIYEELGHPELLNPETRVIIARCYLRDKDLGRRYSVIRPAGVRQDLHRPGNRWPDRRQLHQRRPERHFGHVGRQQ